MAQKLPDLLAQSRLDAALAAGDVYLVNEDGQVIAFQQVLDTPCWAHIRDHEDGRVYVEGLRGRRDLLLARYQQVYCSDV